MFFKLGYPDRLVDATITSFLNSVLVDKDQVKKNNAMSERNIVRVVLPFKDQRSADVLFINLNVICAIQIILATLLVISISELKNIEPPPLVHM